MLVVAFTTNDRQVLSRFCLLVDFVQFLLGTHFVGGAFEDLPALAKILCLPIKVFGRKKGSILVPSKPQTASNAGYARV